MAQFINTDEIKQDNEETIALLNELGVLKARLEDKGIFMVENIFLTKETEVHQKEQWEKVSQHAKDYMMYDGGFDEENFIIAVLQEFTIYPIEPKK